MTDRKCAGRLAVSGARSAASLTYRPLRGIVHDMDFKRKPDALRAENEASGRPLRPQLLFTPQQREHQPRFGSHPGNPGLRVVTSSPRPW